MLTTPELAYLIDVDPKWIHNAALRLKRPIRHTAKEGIRLALARRIHEGIGIPLPHAVQIANEALHGDIDTPCVVTSPDSIVQLHIDITRFLIAINARLAWLRTQAPMAQRGRKPSINTADAIQHAERYGVDISLIRANLRKTPAERLTALNENMQFLHPRRRKA